MARPAARSPSRQRSPKMCEPWPSVRATARASWDRSSATVRVRGDRAEDRHRTRAGAIQHPGRVAGLHEAAHRRVTDAVALAHRAGELRDAAAGGERRRDDHRAGGGRVAGGVLHEAPEAALATDDGSELIEVDGRNGRVRDVAGHGTFSCCWLKLI